MGENSKENGWILGGVGDAILFEFEVVTCRTCRLGYKKAILEVATSNLQKWRGFAQSWGPCMPI